MTWVGMGSWVARNHPAHKLGALVGLSIPLLIANLIAIRLTKCFFGLGMLIGLLPMLALTVVLLAPMGLAFGAIFSWGCGRANARYGFGIGEAYLSETLGAALGGLLYSALIAGRLGPEWTLVILAVPTMMAVAFLMPRRRFLAVAALTVAILFAISPIPLWIRRLQWRGYQLLSERTSRYSHLVVAKTGSLISLFENGVIGAHFPDPAAYEELVHWPLLAHPSPHRVLIIGGAATGSLSEILKHPVTQVDYVELDPLIIQLLTPVLTVEDRAALDDSRVRIIHQDGRRFLARTSETYDVILLQLPEPLNAQINRLYTLEAFGVIRARLAPSGLFAFTIPSSENYLSPETTYFNASLYQTLKAVFPSVELVAGDPLLLLAGVAAVDLDPAILIQRYLQRRLQTREVVPSYFPIKLDERRREALLSHLTTARLIALNRDFVPVCYAVAFRVWLSKFVSPPYFLGVLALLAFVGILLRALWRRRAVLIRTPGPTALFFLGCAGMVYETVLLLAFQAINGYVYWQLGFLFAAFMLGLAAGSGLAVSRLPTLAADQVRRWLRGLLALSGCEGLVLVWVLSFFQRLPAHVPWCVPFSLLLFLTAVWVGLAFPLASSLGSTQPTARVAGTLYAADLWGASLGALLVGAFAIPLIGLIQTVGITGLVLCVASRLLPGPSPVNPHSR